jgi:hypothetical protein
MIACGEETRSTTLLTAVDRAENQPEPVKLIGWL